MAFSTIQKKIGKCKLCPPDSGDKHLTKGLCQFHYKLERGQVYLERQKEKNKVRKLIVTQDNDAALWQVELNKWFDYVAGIIEKNPRCWECGAYIPPKFYRHASAHIFDKKNFPSVATHPLNFLILGAGCGCHDKTHRIDTFCKMKVWKLAVSRFLEFECEIKETHKYLSLFKEQTNKLQ